MKFKNDFLNKKFNYIRYLFTTHKIRQHSEKQNIDNAETILLEGNQQSYLKRYNIGLVRDTDQKPYYTKFERFLINNKLNYKYYNIFSSDWLDRAKDFDIIIWRPMSYYWEIQDSKDKIYFLEKELNKIVIPSFKEINIYENKAMQYYYLKKYNYPVVNTFISSDYNETINFINQTDYPIVSKIKNSSASSDVSLIKSKFTAKRLVNKVFKTGKTTYWPFLKQKNYVIFQEFIENYGYDHRIIVTDQKHIFGYYRHPKKNDFRASGSKIIIKRELDLEAVKIAYRLFKDLKINILACDFLKSKKDDQYYISELSYFVDVITSTQAMKTGKPSRYIYDKKNNTLNSKEGKFWLQELILKNAFISIYNSNNRNDNNE